MMPDSRPLRILHVSTTDVDGGAASVGGNLVRKCREHGHRVWQAVGLRRGADPGVILLPDDRRAAFRWSGYAAVQRGLRRLAGQYPNRGWGLLSRSLRSVTHPGAVVRRYRGVEDFDFPGTNDVLDLAGATPDVVHCHNLHGGYFDLRALPRLSRRVPTVLTLHDMWLLTGHCAHSLGCDRWKSGCGLCPDLDLHPAIRRDASAANWQRKQDIYARSALYVAAPSGWLMQKALHSILAAAVQDCRIIPNGVDLTVFQPADRKVARAAVGIPEGASVVLLTADSWGSMWKDRRTLRSTMERIALRTSATPVVFVALGPGSVLSPPARGSEMCVPHQTDPRMMARYYQAADVYVHAAQADTFPCAIIEAMACGTPVVATDVGGIPEQITPAEIAAVESGQPDAVGTATGMLTPPGDPTRMADAVLSLLANDSPRLRIGGNAARDARQRFDLNMQIDAYLTWYRAILESRRTATVCAKAGQGTR